MQRYVLFCVLFMIAVAGCGGSGDSSSGNTTVGVPNTPGDNAAVVNSISFVSASPKTIGLKGMGGVGVQETSTVTFKVYDKVGKPMGGVEVLFDLNTKVGGLDLTTYSGTTADNGTVSTIVLSGTIATPVRVTATVKGITPAILTQSDQLVVSTGMPAQDGFSISIEKFNTESWNTDGVTDSVTARISDHFHNPVPDGTAVYFTTSGGSIEPSCTTSGGACSVKWTSQNPRPANGRVAVLAYAVGEEAFLDLNGNGVADAGEFTDMTEAFRDDNLNGIYNAGLETFIDFDKNGAFSVADTKYNGILQGTAYVNSPKSKHVFSNSSIIMSSSTPSTPTFNTTSISKATVDADGDPLDVTTIVRLTVIDLNNNPMPAGTTINFDTDLLSGISISAATSFTVPNTLSAGVGATLFDVPIRCSNIDAGSGPVTVIVKSPSGVISRYTFNFSYS